MNKFKQLLLTDEQILQVIEALKFDDDTANEELIYEIENQIKRKLK